MLSISLELFYFFTQTIRLVFILNTINSTNNYKITKIMCTIKRDNLMIVIGFFSYVLFGII